MGEKFIDFSKYEGSDSKFSAELSDRGGYITFSNSGKGGDKKYFTLSLDSFISCLKNIYQNIDKFQGSGDYNEKVWRDLGSAYFSDKPANAQITVQTKPMFATLSKIIMWANSPLLDSLNPEEKIEINPKLIEESIIKLEKISASFTPKKQPVLPRKVLSDKSIRDFALGVFRYFYDGRWGDVIGLSEDRDANVAGENFKALNFGGFIRVIGVFPTKQNKQSLTSAGTQRFYEDPIYADGEKYYHFSTQWNGDGDYSLSFKNLKLYFESNFKGYKLEKNQDFYELIKIDEGSSTASSPACILSKPFMLLAGISGTGKTRFVREQASMASGDVEKPENYELVAVRPDWHEPSDLLGYVSRIGNGGPHYVVTDVLRFMVKAWKAAVDDNAALKPVGDILPYWLCLDEMNLAPVEQYFADYLSVIETRKWENNEYTCDPILKLDALTQQLEEPGIEKLRTDLGVAADGAGNDALWNFFELKKGIPLPPNLIVAGTVNMDETTHGFSRKVIDRAFTIDFGEFFPNDYAEFFEQKTQPKKLGFPVLSQAVPADLVRTWDSDGAKSVAFLSALNELLKQTPFELAYRALNELLLAVACFKPADDMQLQAVWDDFLMTKVLPRIEGDADKLRRKEGGPDGEDLLAQLQKLLEQQLPAIWNGSRPDLLRENIDEQAALEVPTRSKKKLEWMQQRLDAANFTTFWP